MKREKDLTKVGTSKLSNTCASMLESIHLKTKIPKNALMGLLLRQELNKDIPFENILNFVVPDVEELGEYEGIQECQKIKEYLRYNSRKPLHYLLLVRAELQIPSDYIMLCGLSRAIAEGKVEVIEADHEDKHFKEGLKLYAYKEELTKRQQRNKRTKVKKKASKYEQYLELKKEFEGK